MLGSFLLMIGALVAGGLLSMASVALGAHIVLSVKKGTDLLSKDEDKSTGAFSIDTSDDNPLFPENGETGANPDEAHILNKTQNFLKAFGGK